MSEIDVNKVGIFGGLVEEARHFLHHFECAEAVGEGVVAAHPAEIWELLPLNVILFRRPLTDPRRILVHGTGGASELRR